MSRSRKGRIIYYDYKIGGFTLGEWLIYWTWKYFINSISIFEYLAKIDYIDAEMPGALEDADWLELQDYLAKVS